MTHSFGVTATFGQDRSRYSETEYVTLQYSKCIRDSGYTSLCSPFPTEIEKSLTPP